jgi:hypothetical protein
MPLSSRKGRPTKEELEQEKLRRELGRPWRCFQFLALIAPSLTLIVAIFSAGYVYQQNQTAHFRALLKDVGDEKAHTRLSAISRLFTYDESGSIAAMVAQWAFGGLSRERIKQEIIPSVAAAVRIEDNIHVKKEMLRLMVALGGDSLIPLKQVRYDLISELKLERGDKEKTYWDNLRETLFQTAIAISKVADQPPDFRCFPLKGIRLRQQILDDGASFEGATLSYAEFWGGRMRRASFVDSNFFGAVIRDMDLEGATFVSADLKAATLGPNITGLDVEQLKNTNWREVKEFNPRSLGTEVLKKLGRTSGFKRSGKDRDAFCSQLLNTDFHVEQ